MNKLPQNISLIILTITLQVICWSQDSDLIKKNEVGRYMNISATYLETRAIDLGTEYITIENLGSANRTYKVIARKKNIIMTQYEDRVLFFELKRGKIIFYQRIIIAENSIDSYRKGERHVKNTFKKVNLKIYR